MGADDVLLSDVGAHKMWISRYYQCGAEHLPHFERVLHHGLCHAGFRRREIRLPGQEDTLISGDAGFSMNVQELETAVRLKKNIVAMVWVDGEYGLIKWKQQDHFNGKHSDLQFGNPDFAKLAESLRDVGQRSHRCRPTHPNAGRSFPAGRLTLIAVPVDYAENRKLTARLGAIEIPIEALTKAWKD